VRIIVRKFTLNRHVIAIDEDDAVDCFRICLGCGAGLEGEDGMSLLLVFGTCSFHFDFDPDDLNRLF
jgi:hypothetical protein